MDYLLNNLFDTEDNGYTALYNSISDVGIITPILTLKTPSGETKIVDGAKRHKIALEKKIECPTKSITTSPDNTKLEIKELCGILLSSHYNRIKSSITNQVLFISIIQDLNLSKKEITTIFSNTLDIQFHPAVYPELGRIARLPHPILKFAHQKRLSYKQCLNLAHTAPDCMISILSLAPEIQISASLAIELSHYCHQLQFDKITDNDAVAKILTQHLSPSQKSQHIREALFNECHPTLTQTNAKIANSLSDLPNSLSSHWDTSLENKAITLNLKLEQADELSACANTLNSPVVHTAISRALEYL